MKVIIAAGGTGGHIYPGVAIAEEIMVRDPKNEVLFIGKIGGLEKDLIGKENFKTSLIHVSGITRKLSIKSIIAPFISLFGIFECIRIFLAFKPQFVVLTGGYVSFPAELASKVLGIKTLLTEQNVLPGFTNRLISKFVNYVVLTFEESKKYLDGIVVGNPIRARIKNLKKVQKINKRILITGGSQGAKSLNTEILSALDLFKGQDVDIYHSIGSRDYDTLIKSKDLSNYPFYKPSAYMYNIEEVLASTDFVVSRAGATAITEFLALGIPMILVPFPYSAEGHQDLNAEVVRDAGAAIIVKDSNLTDLPRMILSLIKDDAKLKSMSEAALRMAKPDAAKKIVDLIYEKV